MAHECQIYVLFDEKGVVNYVGRTARPIHLRMYEHKQVLGLKPRYMVIDRCSTDCRNVERKWIEHYRERGHSLRNISFGQGPHFLPASSRIKLSEAFKGRPVTWGDKISATQKGRPKNWGPEGRKRVAATQLKRGHRLWESLDKDTQDAIRSAASESWKDPDKRRRMSVGLESRGWHSKSSEEQAEVAKKISAANKDNPRVIAAAKKASDAARNADHTNGARAVKAFWEELRKDPARYQDFITRRASSIQAAKAAKRQS